MTLSVQTSLKTFSLSEGSSLALANQVKTKLDEALKSTKSLKVDVYKPIRDLICIGHQETLNEFRNIKHRKIIPIATALTLLEILHNPKLMFENGLKLEIAKAARIFFELVFTRVVKKGLRVESGTMEEISQKLSRITQATSREAVRTKYSLRCSKIAWHLVMDSKDFAKKTVKQRWKNILLSPFDLKGVLDSLGQGIKKAISLKKSSWYFSSLRIRQMALRVSVDKAIIEKFFERLPSDWNEKKYALFALAEGLSGIIEQSKETDKKRKALNGFKVTDKKTTRSFPGLIQLTDRKFVYKHTKNKDKKKDISWKVRYCAIQLLAQFQESEVQISGPCIDALMRRKIFERNKYVITLLDTIYKESSKQKAWNFLTRRGEIEKEVRFSFIKMVSIKKELEETQRGRAKTQSSLKTNRNKLENLSTLQSGNPYEDSPKKLQTEIANQEKEYEVLQNQACLLEENLEGLEMQQKFLQELSAIPAEAPAETELSGHSGKTSSPPGNIDGNTRKKGSDSTKPTSDSPGKNPSAGIAEELLKKEEE